MDFPVMDARGADAIYAQIRSLAAQYLPEWNFDGEADPGMVLAKVYAEMFADTVRRYNQMPYKHFLFFLNLLGAGRLPGNIACGCVTVELNAGDYSGVAVRRGTRLYKESGARVLYETTDDMLAVDNGLEAIFCTGGNDFQLVRPYALGLPEAEAPRSFRLFDFVSGQNLQNFACFFSEDRVLYTAAKAVVEIRVVHREKPYSEGKVAAYLGDAKRGVWRYCTEGEWRAAQVEEVIGNRIRLLIEGSIDWTESKGEAGRWLSYTANLCPNETEISFTGLCVSAAAESLEPDHLYNNDRELGQRDFLPFGERFGLYDDFYIACAVAFAQGRAKITLAFAVDHVPAEDIAPVPASKIQWKSVMPASAVSVPEVASIKVMQVAWTYWNGYGWSRLPEGDLWQEIFQQEDKTALSLQFICPEDMAETVVGAHAGKWLRVRILRTNQLFNNSAQYDAPIIDRIAVSYAYGESAVPVRRLWLEKNLAVDRQPMNDREVIRLLPQSKNRPPMAWFRFKNALRDGPIHLYFQKSGGSLTDPPALRWEYYALRGGVGRWTQLQVLDGTNFFSESGILTFTCKEVSAERRIFGGSGHWIRAINTDGRYAGTERLGALPEFQAIRLNTVAIRQQETKQSEYFYCAEGEKNKLCQLSDGNLTDCTVWVNEPPPLPVGGRPAAQTAAVREIVVRDAQGMIAAYWRGWDKVDSFAGYDARAQVYRLDEISGKILFGDGIHGQIPCGAPGPGIRVDYKVGAGESGNCVPHAIAAFADSVPFVRSVDNAEPVRGGSAPETMQAALLRSLRLSALQDRAVLCEDYVLLALGANRNVIKVKTVRKMPDGVRIIILPKYVNSGAAYFAVIRRTVLDVLSQKAPLTVVFGKEMEIVEVDYLEFSLAIEAQVAQYRMYQDAMQKIELLLAQYLDPIGGNFNGEGFAIGELPSRADFYRCIKAAPQLRHIDRIEVNCCLLVGDCRTEVDFSAILSYPHAVPVNGRHEIRLNVPKNFL